MRTKHWQKTSTKLIVISSHASFCVVFCKGTPLFCIILKFFIFMDLSPVSFPRPTHHTLLSEQVWSSAGKGEAPALLQTSQGTGPRQAARKGSEQFPAARAAPFLCHTWDVCFANASTEG